MRARGHESLAHEGEGKISSRETTSETIEGMSSACGFSCQQAAEKN